MKGDKSLFVFKNLILSSDFTSFMEKKQHEIMPNSKIKETELGKVLTGKYTPKKDLNRKGANYLEKHVTVKTINRFETCTSWMLHLTNVALSSKRLYKCNACGNRFCPICTWKSASKDAIKISILVQAMKEIERKEFLLLTLTSPNCTGEDLRSEIDNFNKAVKRLFDRRNVKRVVKGYIRKLEVTTDQEQYITEELYKLKKGYFDMRGYKVGDVNPQYNTYNPHVHIIVAVNKSYFKDTKIFISNAEWLQMWREAMKDNSITQVKAEKVRDSKTSSAVLEIAKYTAKGSDLYHSEKVFDTFYLSLKKRQLLVYSGMFKDYAKKHKEGKLDNFKKQDKEIYTHMLRSIWKESKYENKLRELTPEQFQKYNERALQIDDDDDEVE